MTLISIAIANFLLWCGVDVACICGHRYSEHQFDSVTVRGACQNGSWESGCDCLVYEVKGNRDVPLNRGTGIAA